MIRTINERTFLFLCQSSSWQCVIEAEDEETAATISAETIMRNKQDEDKNISMFFAVKKLINNLFNPEIDSEVKLFYAPIILANAGYYYEANKLEEILSLEKNENE
jgi:hypothetical protein